MLQQTQVDRVRPKYEEWLRRYPSFEALAAATVDEVTRVWYPLGYNIRPKRLLAIARETVASYGGSLPDDEETLRSFKGIGAYTAGAVLSCFCKRADSTRMSRASLPRVRRARNLRAHAMRRHLWTCHDSSACASRVRLQPGPDGSRATVCVARTPACGRTWRQCRRTVQPPTLAVRHTDVRRTANRRSLNGRRGATRQMALI
jgi:A/G-specific adenine glycosylase